MRKEILLPAHLYDRIKASAGEHGGMGSVHMFDSKGFPLCAHGHAWGTRANQGWRYEHPELVRYISTERNDNHLIFLLGKDWRIPFWLWLVLLNVKRAPDTPAPEKQSQESRELVSA